MQLEGFFSYLVFVALAMAFATRQYVSRKPRMNPTIITEDFKWNMEGVIEEKCNPLPDVPFAIGALETISFRRYRSLNVAVIGEVSCGKTTFVNALLAKKVSKTARARTTMSVNIFQPTNNYKANVQEILQQLDEYNDKFKQNKSGDAKELLEIQEKEFVVAFIPGFQSIFDDIAYPFNIIDVPGFNDRETNSALEKWLSQKAYLLDVVFFMVDINTGFNTKSITDLLDTVIKNMVKHIYMRIVVIFNKYDEQDEELEDMYKSAVELVKERLKTFKSISPDQVEFVHLSARAAWIYRYYWFNNKSIAALSLPEQTQLATEQFGTRGKKLLANSSFPNVLQNQLRSELVSYESCLLSMPGFKEFTAIFSGLLVNDSVLYVGKMKKLLIYLENKPEISVEMVRYVQEISEDFAVKINAGELITRVLNKFLKQIEQKTMEQFIDQITVFSNLFKTFCFDELLRIFRKKSAVVIAHTSVIQWVQSLHTGTLTEFNGAVKQIIREQFEFEKKEHPHAYANQYHIVQNIDELDGLLQLISFAFIDEATEVANIKTYICEVIRSMFQRKKISKEEEVEPVLLKLSQINWISNQYVGHWVHVVLEQYLSYFQFQKEKSLETLSWILGVLKKINYKMSEELLVQYVRSSIETDGWNSHLFFQDLLRHHFITYEHHYRVWAMIQFCQFNHQLQVDGFIAATYRKNYFKKYPNIMVYFVENDDEDDDL